MLRNASSYAQKALGLLTFGILIAFLQYLIFEGMVSSLDALSVFFVTSVFILSIFRNDLNAYSSKIPIIFGAMLVLVLGIYAQKNIHFFRGNLERYVSLQRSSSWFVDRLYRAEVLYGGQEVVKVARLLTISPFLHAVKIKTTDAATQGIRYQLTGSEFGRLSKKYSSNDFWLGGYHYRMFSGRAGIKKFIFIAPPGEWRNLVLVIPQDAFEDITQQ